jgi:hypothetical protein
MLLEEILGEGVRVLLGRVMLLLGIRVGEHVVELVVLRLLRVYLRSTPPSSVLLLLHPIAAIRATSKGSIISTVVVVGVG